MKFGARFWQTRNAAQASTDEIIEIAKRNEFSLGCRGQACVSAQKGGHRDGRPLRCDTFSPPLKGRNKEVDRWWIYF